MSMLNNFCVRELRQSDRSYVIRTVLMSYSNDSYYIKSINRDSYLTSHNKIINNLLNSAKTLIVCDPIDTDLVIAFIIYEHTESDWDIFHYAFTRKEFRKLGLLLALKSLIKTKDCLALSHKTDSISPARLKRHYGRVINDPYLQIKE